MALVSSLRWLSVVRASVSVKLSWLHTLVYTVVVVARERATNRVFCALMVDCRLDKLTVYVLCIYSRCHHRHESCSLMIVPSSHFCEM